MSSLGERLYKHSYFLIFASDQSLTELWCYVNTMPQRNDAIFRTMVAPSAYVRLLSHTCATNSWLQKLGINLFEKLVTLIEGCA